MTEIKSFGVNAEKEKLKLINIQRRDLNQNDIKIDIEFCGVCHTDIHFVDNDWGMSNYPLVPGHEIIGRCRTLEIM